ncbi:MAG: twin transmembrane helix small protein [Limnohabitans sp.]
MKIMVTLAFAAILASLAFALIYMMRAPRDDSASGQPPPKGRMATALAFRVGFSILLFLCVVLALNLGWIHPTGIPSGA